MTDHIYLLAVGLDCEKVRLRESHIQRYEFRSYGLRPRLEEFYASGEQRGERHSESWRGYCGELLVTPEGRWFFSVHHTRRFNRGDWDSRPRYFEARPIDVADFLITHNLGLPPASIADADAEFFVTNGLGLPPELVEVVEGRAKPPEASPPPDDATCTMVDILVAAEQLKAFDKASHQPLSRICAAAGGVSQNARNVRDSLKRLKDAGFFGSSRGQNGGGWITPEGRAFLARRNPSIPSRPPTD